MPHSIVKDMDKLIYLDNNASTPCDPRVVHAMMPYFTERCGNPSAVIHEAGKVAADAVERAREQVASLIGAVPVEIIFTSGASESNNLAIRGLSAVGSLARRGLVTTAVEHKSVIEPCRALQNEGVDVRILPVDSAGVLSVEDAVCALDDRTLLASIQLANNETGTIQNVAALAERAHRVGALVHCDAAQAAGKIPVNVDELGVDLLSLSAHKLYGPKGVGALFVRGGHRSVRLSPLALGGGQEHGLRPGTLNVPGIVGLGEACRLCCSLDGEPARIASMRDRLESDLAKCLDQLTINGALDNRLPNTSSVTLHGVDAETLIAHLRGVAISAGSACTSGAPAPSHVLTAMGLSREDAYSTIRIGLGRFTTCWEIDRFVELVAETCTRLRSLAGETAPVR